MTTKKKVGRPKKEKHFDKFIETYEGMDKRRGRPIRINYHELEVRNGVAEVIFFGDLHWGSPQCETERAKDMLNWALKNKVYVLCMGDMLESATRDSVGAGVYEQSLNPQKQMEEVIELFRPLAKAGLILGWHSGNHEDRIRKTTSIDISMLMANILDIPYLGYAGWSLFKVGKQKYSVYSTHGSGGSRFKHTKMKKAMDYAGFISADIIAHAHVHALGAEPISRQTVDKARRRVVEDKSYVVLTGSYLSYDGSYAQAMGMPPCKLGSPKCKFGAEDHNFHFSL